MPFVLGWNALFGRTDKVPGLLFVGTSFFYFCFIPLIPLGSYIVRYEDDYWFGGFKGVPIGISIKSVLFAWIRAAAVVAILFSTWKFICDYVVHILYWGGGFGWQDFAAMSLGLAALWILRVASVASSERAMQRSQRSGVTVELSKAA